MASSTSANSNIPSPLSTAVKIDMDGRPSSANSFSQRSNQSTQTENNTDANSYKKRSKLSTVEKKQAEDVDRDHQIMQKFRGLYEIFEQPLNQMKDWPFYFETKEAAGHAIQKGFRNLWSTFIIVLSSSSKVKRVAAVACHDSSFSENIDWKKGESVELECGIKSVDKRVKPNISLRKFCCFVQETLLAGIAIQPFVSNAPNISGWQLEVYGGLWTLALLLNFLGLGITALFLGYLLGNPNHLAWVWVCKIVQLIGIPVILVLLDTIWTLITICFSSWLIYGPRVGIICAVVAVFAVAAGLAICKSFAKASKEIYHVGNLSLISCI